MDLSSPTGLTQACQQALATREADSRYKEWTRRMAEQISYVQQADRREFDSIEFQKNLWENEAISATGLGNVPTKNLWQDRDTIDRLWITKSLDSTPGANAFVESLIDSWDGLIARIRELGQRVPRLKLARAFAALQPGSFTTIASRSALVQLAKAMGIQPPNDRTPRLNRRILERLDSAVSDTDLPRRDDWHLLRMKLPWMLYEEISRVPAKGITTKAGREPGSIQLQPLPANRRRRGLLAIAGYFDSILAMLEFAKDGCSRTDFREHIHSINENLAPASINTNINALIAEWGAVQAEGDHITLTERGQALLESGDPEEVCDWLLTQILGFDNALVALKDGALEQKQLISAIQSVNPGWTSNFAPTAMVAWLRSLGLVADKRHDKSLALTARGEEWLARIYWTPEQLASRTPLPPAFEPAAAVAHQPARLPRRTIKELAASFPPGFTFSEKLIARLDAALWSHPRRHFAVLAGLSGSGKTQLAANYAKSLWFGEAAVARDEGVYILPVQPGWHDPSALLGYVNPFDTEKYVQTGFLKFLLNAARDPDRPYTVVLDEMNLSHPEQYFAPLLSAMETGGRIELHANGDEVEEIPASLVYPPNLVIIGTVNMDETTHGLSDKVLDRAFVIEFWDVNLDAWPGWSTCFLPDKDRDLLKQVLGSLGKVLAPVHLHFGWRTVDDVSGYVQAMCNDGVTAFSEALDQAIYAKVLPKLRGDDNLRLRNAFEQAARLLKQYGLHQSEAKLDELHEELVTSGTARFWR